MYIIRRNKGASESKSLRELLLDFMSENDISVNALADEIKANNDTLRKFLCGEVADLKFMQAIRVVLFQHTATGRTRKRRSLKGLKGFLICPRILIWQH